MFEPHRYFEKNENNLGRARRIGRNFEIICSPELDEIFSKLFGRLEDGNGVAQVKKPKDDFHWKIDDIEDDEDEEGFDEGDAYEDDEPPYIHEQDVMCAEDEEDEEIERVPPSIFDMLSSGKEFKDLVSLKQPKRTEILDDEEEEEDERDENVKNPFVFIANRLTFLIKTSQPIVWDTSTIATPSKDCIFIAFNQHKNPQLDMRRAAKIAHAVNMDKDIQDEIEEYLEGTDWESIFCAPHIMVLNGEDRLGFVFAVTSREDD